MRTYKPFSIGINYDRTAGFRYMLRVRISTKGKVAAILRGKMTWAVCLFAYFFILNSAQAQINSGTIIVFQLVNDKFLIAADSRTMSIGAAPDDTYCKIAAFRQHLVFARSGGGGYKQFDQLDPVKTWDSRDHLHAAVMKNLSISSASATQVTALADDWVAGVKQNWEVTYLYHPDVVKNFADYQHGNLVIGIFALTTNGTIMVTARALTFSNGVISASTPAIDGCDQHPCAMGVTDVPAEYLSATSDRAKNETYTASAEVLARMGKDMAKVIRIADLTIAYDSSGKVGGPIDALALAADGSLEWIARKQTCQGTEN